MSAVLFREQPRALSGAATLPGASMSFYAEGTDDQVAVYADRGRTIELPNPLVANAAARFPPIYFDLDAMPRVVLESAAGAEIWDEDPLQVFPGSDTNIPLDDVGGVMPLCVYTFWQHGTTELAQIFATSDLDGVQLDNPLSADSNGEFPDIWLDDALDYRVKLEHADGRLVYDIDPVQLLAPRVVLNAAEFEDTIGYDPGFGGSITGDINDQLPTAQTLEIRRIFNFDTGQLIVRLRGSVSTPPADVFSSLSFADKAGEARTLLSSAAATTTPATRTRQWDWSGPGDYYFEAGESYPLRFVP